MSKILMKVKDKKTGKYVLKEVEQDIVTAQYSKPREQRTYNIDDRFSLYNDNQPKETPWYKNIFSSGKFKDGYDFGDITTSTLATGGDILANLGKGYFSIADSLGKLMAGGAAQVADWIGKDEDAERIRNNIAGKNEKVNRGLEYFPSGLLEKASKKMDSSSFVGETGDEFVQGAGYYGGMAALQTVGVPWQATAGVTSAGNELGEAYKNGATNAEAWMSAGISAAVEIGSEYMSGGLKLPGTGKTADKMITKVTDKITKRAPKYLLQLGFQLGGEGAEEVISGFGQAIGRKLTYMKDKDLKELYSSEDALRDFVSGVAVTFLTTSASPNTYRSIKNNQSLITGRTAEQAKQIEQEANNIIKQYKESGIEITSKKEQQIYDQVANDITQRQIAVQQIEQQSQQALIDFEDGKITKKELSTILNNFKQNLDNVQNNTEINQNNENNNLLVDNVEQQENELYNKLNNNEITMEEFKQQVEDMTRQLRENMNDIEYATEFEKTATQYQYNATAKEIRTIGKMLDVRGITAVFDNTIGKDNAGLWSVDENGNRTIRINPEADANTIIQEVAIHELTHDMLSSENSRTALNIDEMLEVVSKTEGYQGVRQRLEEAYSRDYDPNSPDFKAKIDEEVVADVLSKKLGTQEYVNRLVGENPSVAKKIYNWVLDKLDNIGKSKEYIAEKKYWKNVADRFENAYKMEYNNTTQEADVRYAKSNIREDFSNALEPQEWYHFYDKVDKHGLEQKQIGSKNITFINDKIIKSEYDGEKPIVKDVYQAINDDVILNKYGIDTQDIIQDIYEIAEEDNVDEGKIQKVIQNYFEKGLLGRYDSSNNLFVGKDQYSRADIGQDNSNSGRKRGRRNNLSETNEVNRRLNDKKSKEGTSDSSFSFDENVKRYEDLKVTNKLEFFRKDNGDVRVYFIDSNNNLINEIDTYSETDAIKQFGTKIGEHLFQKANDTNQTISIGNDINNTGSETDYFMNHRPTESGITADNLINQDVESPMPTDMYEHPEYYFMMNEKYSKESMQALNKIRNNPNAEITIYRATTGNKINKGDWVTLSKTYAEHHNYSQFDGKGNVVELKAKAKDIQFAGDDINEWGYFPVSNEGTRMSKETPQWQKFLDDNFKSNGTKTKMSDLKKIEVGKKMLNDLTLDKVKQDKIDDEITKRKTLASREGIKEASKTAKDYLGFNNKEYSSFKEQLNSFTNKSKSELVNSETYNQVRDIIKEYSERQVAYSDEYANDVKKYLRNQQIQVSEEIKNDITDYNYFRKSNFGKLKLGDTGTPVDTFYQELCETYPGTFDENIINPSDQLQAISDFVNRDSNYYEKIKLSDSEIENLTRDVYNKLTNKTLSDADIEEINNEMQKKMDRKHKISRKDIRRYYQEEIGISAEELLQAEDISSLNYQRTTPIRVNEKVFSKDVAKKVNDALFVKERHNEAERTRWINSEKNSIKELGIKPFSKESAAIQKYAEKQYTNEQGETIKYGDKELAQEFPNIEEQNQIKEGAKQFRAKYDEILNLVNEVLEKNGYDPIPARSDYMPHFQEMTDIFSKLGLPFNPEVMNSEDLPTDINGLTEFNSPGKSWFANAKRRKGMKTSYDAITGFDKYIDSVSNVIYHTDDIQRYRAFEEQIRTTFGQTEGFENILSDPNATNEQIEDTLEKIKTNHLSKYAAWLHEQGNSLAGKKGAIDRGVERFFGRKIYTGLNTLKSQVGSNMTGLNVRSAMTNFISSTIAAAKTNKVAMAKGTYDTIKNIFHNDGFINKSDFLTSRLESNNQLSRKFWQKATNAGQIFMTGSDWFTSNLITRSKYYEGLSKGMTDAQAINYADDFAARVLGDRSKGQTAEMFNSKTLGFFTQFQLETTNQWDYMVHDTIYENQGKSGIQKANGIIFQMGQLAVYSYLFNELFEKLAGSRAAFDPIEIIKKLLGSDDDDKDKDFNQRLEEAGDLLFDALPMGNLISGGGRIPMGEAVPVKELVTGEDKYGNKKPRTKTIKETLPYYLMPTGYGQLKKTTKGLAMYNKKNEVKGSYTDSGNLRFTADTSTGGKIKAGLFGQWASKDAKDYINSGYKTINQKRTQELKDLNMTSSEYRKYRIGLNNAGTTREEKLNYINNLNVSDKKKNIMGNYLISSNKYKFDINEYNQFDSYDDYKAAKDNPGKYNSIKTIFGDFNKGQKEIKKFETLREKYKSLNSIHRKNKIHKILRESGLSKAEIGIIMRTKYKSFDNYNYEIVQEINNSELNYEEAVEVYKNIGFTVKGGRVYW